MPAAASTQQLPLPSPCTAFASDVIATPDHVATPPGVPATDYVWKNPTNAVTYVYNIFCKRNHEGGSEGRWVHHVSVRQRDAAALVMRLFDCGGGEA